MVDTLHSIAYHQFRTLQFAFFIHNTTRISCTKVTILVWSCIGAKPFPANQKVKYECFHCAFQRVHIFAHSVQPTVRINDHQWNQIAFADTEYPMQITDIYPLSRRFIDRWHLTIEIMDYSERIRGATSVRHARYLMLVGKLLLKYETRTRSLGHGYVITPHSIPWDVITYPWPWHIILASHRTLNAALFTDKSLFIWLNTYVWKGKSLLNQTTRKLHQTDWSLC